jgi:hypothetical protein
MSARKYTVNTMTTKESATAPKTALPALTTSLTTDPPEPLIVSVIRCCTWEALVEPTDGRGVVLGLLKVMRCLLDELAGLLHKRGDGSGDEGPHHCEEWQRRASWLPTAAVCG